MLGPSPERQDVLAQLLLERHAIPARIDQLEVEPLEPPGGPPLSDLVEQLRAERLQ